VFDELFTAGGHDLYVKQVTEYVRPGEATFDAVCEAALRRNQIAVGYRLNAATENATRGFGVVVGPAKSTRLVSGPEDQVIVLAREIDP